MKLGLSGQDFEKYSNFKFHENPSCGSRVVPYEQTNRLTDMKQPIAFRNTENTPKNEINRAMVQEVNQCPDCQGLGSIPSQSM
jgi:hypothetical protein